MPFRAATSLMVQKGFGKRKEEELLKAFHEADKDHDGFLSMTEYVRVFKEHGINITKEEVMLYFANKDKDRDGKISFEEFCGRKTKAEAAFEALDINDDGFVTKPEMLRACSKYTTGGGRRLSMKEVDSAFQLFDEDKDNKLSYTEFCAMMNRRKSLDPEMINKQRSRSGSTASIKSLPKI